MHACLLLLPAQWLRLFKPEPISISGLRLGVRRSQDDGHVQKLESLIALGNMRDAPV